MNVKDPVCGIEIDSEKAFAKRERDGGTFYFDSPDCVNKFEADHTNTATHRNMSTMKKVKGRTELCAQ